MNLLAMFGVVTLALSVWPIIEYFDGNEVLSLAIFGPVIAVSCGLGAYLWQFCAEVATLRAEVADLRDRGTKRLARTAWPKAMAPSALGGT